MIERAFKHLLRVSDVMLHRLRLEREITIFPDDVFLTSYPRSGNTWTRFLVANLAYPKKPVTFLSIETLVPDMYKSADRTLRRLPRPRILKSHEPFDPRYKRVVYIVRDPRDSAVSNYYWELKQKSFPDDYPIDDFIPRWMAPTFWPRIGSWGEHVMSWLSTRHGKSGFVLVRYEDLKSNPAPELAKVAGLLGLESTPAGLARAIELSSADQMRNLEKTEGAKWAATKYTRPDKPFVRSAVSGGWQSIIPEKSVALIESTWGPIMKLLGYELTTPVACESVLPESVFQS
jgi:Sulfotransferase domain